MTTKHGVRCRSFKKRGTADIDSFLQTYQKGTSLSESGAVATFPTGMRVNRPGGLFASAHGEDDLYGQVPGHDDHLYRDPEYARDDYVQA
ncbi:MAG: hypothetical protein V1766_09230 [Pseudomonadota bacterium]